MNKPGMTRLAGVAALAIGASVAVGLPAQASVAGGGGGGGGTDGTCTGSSDIRLDVMKQRNTLGAPQDDKLKVTARITRGQRGDELTFVIADNGNKVDAGTKNTGKKGKTTIRKTIRNVEGNDLILFTSTNQDTLEICTAEVLFDR